MRLTGYLIAMAVAAVPAVPVLAQIPADGAGLTGLYAGSYQCRDGEHGVVLDLTFSPAAEGDRFRVSGTLGIVPVLAGAGGEAADVAGSFVVLGVMQADGSLDLIHQGWVIAPPDYGAANLLGTLSQRADGLWQIAGTPVAGPEGDYCQALIATRILP